APERATDRQSRPFEAVDGVTVLTLHLVLLFAIPARLTFGPLGGAGSPAVMVGIVSAAIWICYRISVNRTTAFIAQPIRRTSLLFFAVLLLSFVAACVRPINAEELQNSQLTLLTAFGWMGILLMACDGIPDLNRLQVYLGRLSVGAGLFAALGLVQYLTGLPLTNFIVIPGLSANQALGGLASRDGFNRPASTAIHPIEFGVVITALLPICLHVAMHHRHRGAVRRWFPVIAIAVAVPISISRSAIVGAVVALVCVVPTWAPRARALALAVLGALSVAVFVLLPGIIGTLTGLFAGASTDPSALSRTDSYALAAQFIEQSPIFGRGIGTFLPKYRILDNQYLLLTIEAGFLGVVLLLTVLITALVSMSLVRRRSSDPIVRSTAQACFAGIACAAVGYALFDGFAFPTFASVSFLLLGLAGATWRLTAGPQQQWLRAVATRSSGVEAASGP
ncbi:MAG: O-antigen ligase family protein, partial [Lapillicoccus sp.]